MVKIPSDHVEDLRDAGSIQGLGISPGGGHVNLLPYSCLANQCHRQKNLAGYGPQGRKESDTTERTSRAGMHSTQQCTPALFFFKTALATFI